MTAEALILLALFLPLAGGLGIALAHGRPNLREAVSLATAAGLALAVWSLLPEVMAGARPAV
ncbi:MAG: monovalent cation/H+ antiporter subunit D family protein, partial [Pseudomonadota bacterium]|nr:monovalent cation/H+ antiporter subunit D family protein [Pseudomonadota bacterium]